MIMITINNVSIIGMILIFIHINHIIIIPQRQPEGNGGSRLCSIGSNCGLSNLQVGKCISNSRSNWRFWRLNNLDLQRGQTERNFRKVFIPRKPCLHRLCNVLVGCAPQDNSSNSLSFRVLFNHKSKTSHVKSILVALE